MATIEISILVSADQADLRESTQSAHPWGDLVLCLDLCTRKEENVYRSLGSHLANTDIPGIGFEADGESVHSASAPAVPLALLGPSTACLPAFSRSGISFCLTAMGPADPTAGGRSCGHASPSAPLYPKWSNILYWSVVIPA